MKLARAAVMLLAVALTGLLSAGCAAQNPGRSFALPGLARPAEHITLAGYAGRPVIVTFFASWCPTCAETTAMIARYHRGYPRQAPVVGVDISDQRRAGLALVRATRVTFPVAAAPTLAYASAYGALGLPATYFLDAQHRVVKRVLGPITWQQLQDDTILMHNPAAIITPTPTPTVTASP